MSYVAAPAAVPEGFVRLRFVSEAPPLPWVNDATDAWIGTGTAASAVPVPDVEEITLERPSEPAVGTASPTVAPDLESEDELALANILPEPAGQDALATLPPLRTRPQVTNGAAGAPDVASAPPPFDPTDDVLTDGGEHPLVGGRYALVGRLAMGGLARIYRARHVHLGKEFALKILHEGMARDPAIRERFVREARVLSLMDHPNIVKVTDFGVDEHVGAYIVMELLHGQTLLDELRSRGRLPLHRAVYVALKLADALCYVHARGIVHCDVKSENVLLYPVGHHQRRKQVKLIDFGISRERSPREDAERGELGGTPHYMAPEHIRGRAPHPSMDIYSLGVLLYEVICGRLPFQGDALEVLQAQLREMPRPPSAFLDSPLPPSLERFVLKTLEKDPIQRPLTMATFLYELRTVAEMLDLPVARGAYVEPSMERGPEASLGQSVQRAMYPVFRLDTDATVLEANPAFAEFVGTSTDQVRGLPLASTRLGGHFPEISEALGTHLRHDPGAPFQRQLSLPSSTGRALPLLLAVAPERPETAGVPRAFTAMLIPLLTPRRPKP